MEQSILEGGMIHLKSNIELSKDPYFQRIKYVIQKYRENIDDGPSDYPTPSEFLRSANNQ